MMGMNISEVEKINQLAMTLKKNGLAASMSEAVDKAREILLGVSKDSLVIRKDTKSIEKEIEKVEEDIKAISEEHIDDEAGQEMDEEVDEEVDEEIAEDDTNRDDDDSQYAAGEEQEATMTDAAREDIDTKIPEEDIDLTKDTRPLKELMKEADIKITELQEPDTIIEEDDEGQAEDDEEQAGEYKNEQGLTDNAQEDNGPVEESEYDAENDAAIIDKASNADNEYDEAGESKASESKTSESEAPGEDITKEEDEPIRHEEKKPDLTKYFNFNNNNQQ